MELEKTFGWTAMLAIGAAAAVAFAAEPPQVVEQAEVRAMVEVGDLSAEGATVRGVVANHTEATVRGVEVRVQWAWRWADEFNPGDDAPGFAETVTLEGEIAPGGTAPFELTASRPIPNRDDGHFELNASIVRFSRIVETPAPAGAPAAD